MALGLNGFKTLPMNNNKKISDLLEKLFITSSIYQIIQY